MILSDNNKKLLCERSRTVALSVFPTIFYYKIIKFIYKLEKNFKQNNQKPPDSGTLWWAKIKDTISGYNIPISLRKLLSQEKRLEQRKNKQDLALNPPPQNAATIKNQGFSSIIEFLAQVETRRNLSPDKIFLWQNSQEETATKMSPRA